MNFSVSALAAGFIFGVFGVYFLRQGKKLAKIPAILVGVVLLVYPYFIANPFLLWGLGVALLVLGFRLVL